MAEIPPVILEYQGEGEFKPASVRWANLADKNYVIGEKYAIVPVAERSQKSHAHYFALINEAWMNLPDNLSEIYPTSEHLRKAALIRAGYCDVQNVTCATKAEALRWANVARSLDEYSVVSVHASVVSIYRARSQSYKAMPNGEFQRSKEAVLGVLSEMIGAEISDLKRSAEPHGAENAR